MTIDTNAIVRVMLQIVMTSLQTANVVRHYKAVAGTGGDPAIILTAIGDRLELALNQVAAMTPSVQDSYGAVMWLWDSVLNRFDGVASEATTGYSGTNVTDPLPAQNAAQIDLHTNIPRRQGRIFIPGFCEDQVTDGSIVPAAIVQMGLCGVQLVSDVIADGVTMSPGVWNIDPTSVYNETFELLNGTIGVETHTSTQRRRKPNVGI